MYIYIYILYIYIKNYIYIYIYIYIIYTMRSNNVHNLIEASESYLTII